MPCGLRSAMCSARSASIDNLQIALNTEQAFLQTASSTLSCPSVDVTDLSAAGATAWESCYPRPHNRCRCGISNSFIAETEPLLEALQGYLLWGGPPFATTYGLSTALSPSPGVKALHRRPGSELLKLIELILFVHCPSRAEVELL